MDSVRKLEKSLVDFYKQWPHLPSEVTKFLSDFAWILALIGVIIGVLGVISVLSVTLLGSAILVGMGGAAGAVVGGAITATVIISLLFSIVILYLEAIAVKPLKNKQKRGWDYIFYALLVSVASAVVSLIFGLNFVGLIFSLIWAVIGGYFLFEVRDQFAASARHTEGKREKVARPATVTGKK